MTGQNPATSNSRRVQDTTNKTGSWWVISFTLSISEKAQCSQPKEGHKAIVLQAYEFWYQRGSAEKSSYIHLFSQWSVRCKTCRCWKEKYFFQNKQVHFIICVIHPKQNDVIIADSIPIKARHFWGTLIIRATVFSGRRTLWDPCKRRRGWETRWVSGFDLRLLWSHNWWFAWIQKCGCVFFQTWK